MLVTEIGYVGGEERGRDITNPVIAALRVSLPHYLLLCGFLDLVGTLKTT